MTVVATMGRCVNFVVMPMLERFSGWPRHEGGFGMGVVSHTGCGFGRGVRVRTDLGGGPPDRG